MAILTILLWFAVVYQSLKFFVITVWVVAGAAHVLKVWYGDAEGYGENHADAANGKEWEHETACLIKGGSHSGAEHVA